MNTIRKILIGFFKLLEFFALLCMIIMILVVFIEVIKRYLFGTGYNWSQEISTLLMVWFGFAGIAIGVIEKIHMSIELFTMKLPKKIIKLLERINAILISIFGCFMIYYGLIIMNITKTSTLPATKWPSAVLYFILPFSGTLVFINGVLLIFNKAEKFILQVNQKSEQEIKQ